MKIDYHNVATGRSKPIFAIRYIACIIRTWYYFHIKYRGRVKYKGFVRVMHDTTFERKGITIGHNVQFGPFCRVMAETEFHNNVLMAGNVYFIGKHDHDYSIPGQTIWNGARGVDKKTVIEDDVWIGHGVIILSGVRVGKGSVIAAGAVVTKDIPPCEIWGGNPAKKIKNRFLSEEEKTLHLAYLDTIAKQKYGSE